MMIAHVGWANDPSAYLNERWGAIQRAADLLTRWRDPVTKLHAPAQEDDQAEMLQTLHGAITTFGSLSLAARAAKLIGKEEEYERWGRRADELREAILTEFWLDDERRFETDALASWNPGSAASGPTAWLVWPHTLLPLDDERVQAQLDYDFEAITPALTLEAEGGAYYMKNTVSLALAWSRDPAKRERLANTLEQLAAQATNTGHFGETMQVIDLEGQRVARQQVSTPHLWEGTLYYLTAMALESPERFFAYETILPPPAFLDPTPSLEPTTEYEAEANTEMSDTSAEMAGDVAVGEMNASARDDGGCHSALRRGADQQHSPLLLLTLMIIATFSCVGRSDREIK